MSVAVREKTSLLFLRLQNGISRKDGVWLRCPYL